MEEVVKDAVLTGEFSDLVLLRLIDLTATSIQDKRPLFPGLMDEPVFYRKYFYPWVNEALEEKKTMLAAQTRDVFSEE